MYVVWGMKSRGTSCTSQIRREESSNGLERRFLRRKGTTERISPFVPSNLLGKLIFIITFLAYVFIPEAVCEERIGIAGVPLRCFCRAASGRWKKASVGLLRRAVATDIRRAGHVTRFSRVMRGRNEGESAEQENRNPWLVATTMANRLECGMGVPATFVSHRTCNFKVVKPLNEIFIPLDPIPPWRSGQFPSLNVFIAANSWQFA